MGQGLNDIPAANLALTRWRSPGHVAEEFLRDRRKAVFICGPVGSGKSTAADVVKPLMKATMQIPGVDGVRHYRLITFRDTQRNAWKSTIPTVNKWLPQDIGDFTGSEDRPVRFHFDMLHPVDGGLIKVELWWFGMPDSLEKLEQAFKGVETTDINFAEATGLPHYAFEWAIGRLGRHPSGPLGTAVNSQLFGTLNSSDFDSWVYELCIANPLPDIGYHQQPPAVIKSPDKQWVTNPLAENLSNLENPDYYGAQARLARPGYIRRNLLCEWGPLDAEGYVVYPEFENGAHVGAFDVIDGPVFAGMDGGGTPAAALFQQAADGTLLVFDEVVIYDPEDEKRMRLRAGVGPTAFADAVRNSLNIFSFTGLAHAWGDPAAFFGSDAAHGDLAFMERLGRLLDCRIDPALNDGNARVAREEPLRLRLSQRGDGGRPRIIIHPRCRFILMGLRGAFEYQAVRRNGVMVANDRRAVVKNVQSHVCEALEYGICGKEGGLKVLRGNMARKPMGRPGGQTGQYQSKGVRW